MSLLPPTSGARFSAAMNSAPPAAPPAAVASGSLLAAMLDAMPGPAMLLDRHRHVVRVNRVLAAAMAADGAGLGDRLLPGDVLGCMHACEPGGCGSTESCGVCGANFAIRNCLESRAPVVSECRIVTQRTTGGGALDFRAHASFLEVDGEPFVIVALEPTEHEKRRQVLEHTFFHDLLDTCGGIRGLAELLDDPERDARGDAGVRSDLCTLSMQVIEQIAAQRQLLLAERGELALRLQPVQLLPFFEEVVALHRLHDVCEGRTLHLVVPRPETIVTDAVLLGRVAGNLIRNALEATPADGVVNVLVQHGALETIVSVHNAGAMPRSVQLQVFQRSFTTKPGEGRGIGTYSARLFAERYLRGRVGFASGERDGTVFELVLPNRHPDA